jgi:hypothetical protein
MKQRLYSALVLISLLLVTGNCIDPILFPIVDTSNGVLVVYGQINNLEEPQYIYLSRSSVNNEAPEPVRFADVSIQESGNTVYFFSDDGTKPGRYKLEGFTGIPGRSYQLFIKTGNKTYQSAIEIMPTAIGSDSLSYEISDEAIPSEDLTRLTYKLNVFAKSKLPIEGNYYWRWDPWEVYYIDLTNFPDPFNSFPPDCFATDRVDPQRINLIDGSTIKKPIVEQQIAAREIDYSFKNRHYIISRQLSTTRGSYEYWNKVKSLLGNSGSPFDVPPAPIVGNIISTTNADELVLGYFEACRATESRFFLVPGYIPYPIEPYCDFNPLKQWNEYPPVCLDCSKAPNGTSVRPSWF